MQSAYHIDMVMFTHLTRQRKPWWLRNLLMTISSAVVVLSLLTLWTEHLWRPWVEQWAK